MLDRSNAVMSAVLCGWLAVSSSPSLSAANVSQAGGRGQDAASTQQKGAVIDESRLERRTTPVSCVGRQVVTLRNILLKSDAIAVAVSGDCEVRIQDSHIVGQIALQVAGGGTVSITNSIVEGTIAMQLTPPADVSVKSSTIRGQVQRVGSVSLKDAGGNLWR